MAETKSRPRRKKTNSQDDAFAVLIDLTKKQITLLKSLSASIKKLETQLSNISEEIKTVAEIPNAREEDFADPEAAEIADMAKESSLGSIKKTFDALKTLKSQS